MDVSVPLELIPLVALRKESVDRNKKVLTSMYMYGVALRKESVDRNLSMGLDGRFKL